MRWRRCDQIVAIRREGDAADILNRLFVAGELLPRVRVPDNQLVAAAHHAGARQARKRCRL